MEFFAFTVLVLGLIGAGILRRHLREAKQLELRQIIHAERLKAMDHNTPLTEVDDASLFEQFVEDSSLAPKKEDHGVKLAILWVRVVALCVGLASFFGGIATCVGFYLANDPEFSNYWAMGLIPTLIGVGLLLFYVISKPLKEQVTSET